MANRAFNRADMASRGKIGGHVKASRYSPDELTAAARAGFRRKLELQVDPDGSLPEHERARRVEQARRAFYAGMARKRWQTRRARLAAIPTLAASEDAPGDLDPRSPHGSSELDEPSSKSV